VTINCPERGLLLMRVRDEHKMTLAAYQTLYKSSIEYGMRKQVESEEGMDELEFELKKAQEDF
jgi:dynein light intermediate chain